jgi:hypothetical protein
MGKYQDLINVYKFTRDNFHLQNPSILRLFEQHGLDGARTGWSKNYGN